MKLSDLKPGDKFTVEAEVFEIRGHLICFNLGGVTTRNHMYRNQAEQVEVTKIVPPKTTVEIGDRFRGHHTRDIYTVHGVYEDYYLYTVNNVNHPYVSRLSFLDQKQYTFLGNAKDGDPNA